MNINYHFLLAPGWAEKLRCEVVSFNEKIIVPSGTNLTESLIEKEFKTLQDKFKIKSSIKK